MRAGSSARRAGRVTPGCSARGRIGLTLLEVIVALALTGLLLLGGRLVTSVVTDGAARIAVGVEALDRRANGRRLLHALLRQAERGSREEPFGGDGHGVRFTTWCTVPGGWRERCRAALEIVGGDAPALVAVLSTGETVPLAREFAHGSIRYIGSAARGGTWYHLWEEGTATPVAVAIVLDGDTTIVPVGSGHAHGR